jgi:hypothetical protein
VRSSDGSASGLGEDLVQGEVESVVLQDSHDPPVPVGPGGLQPAQPVLQRPRPVGQEVHEQVHRGRAHFAGEFATLHEPDPDLGRRRSGLRQPFDGVVVGERHRRQPLPGRDGHERRRLVRPVGGGGVGVEIDHSDDRTGCRWSQGEGRSAQGVTRSPSGR